MEHESPVNFLIIDNPDLLSKSSIYYRKTDFIIEIRVFIIEPFIHDSVRHVLTHSFPTTH